MTSCHILSIIMSVCLLDGDCEDGVTSAAVLVHVMAADSSVGLPLGHQLVHLQASKKEDQTKDKTGRVIYW